MGKIVVRKINVVDCKQIDKNYQRCKLEVLDDGNHRVGGGFLTLPTGVRSTQKKRCPPDDPFCDLDLPNVPIK